MRRFDGMCFLILGHFDTLRFEDVDRAIRDLGAECEHVPSDLGPEGCDVLVVGKGVLPEEVALNDATEVMDEAAFAQAVGWVGWSLDAKLEQLRAVFAGEPSAQEWEAMCAVFDGWPWEGHGLDVAVEYAMEHLRHWPEALRVLPRRWVRCDEWMEVDPRLDLASVSDPLEGGGGYLVCMTRPEFFEPFEKVPTRGKLKGKDAQGRRVWLQDGWLRVTDAQGVVARPTPDVAATTVGFSSCERYIWALESRPEQSMIRLLDARSLEVADERGLEHEAAPHYWEDFGFEPIYVSADGRQIAVYAQNGDTIGVTCVFWQDNGQIELVPLEVTERITGTVVGFAPDGSRIILVSGYLVLSVFSLPEGRLLWTGGALDYEDEFDTEMLHFDFTWDAKGNCGFGAGWVLVPVIDDSESSWGISVHDLSTGEPVESISAFPLGSDVMKEVISPRFCRSAHGTVLRYLPPLRLLRPSVGMADPT